MKMVNPMSRIATILQMQPKIEAVPGAPLKLQPENFKGEIEFKDVKFTFPTEPNKPVLKGFSFTAKAGQKVGFCGSTGCGKSTSMYLLQRMYAADAGQIFVDGVPIEEYDVGFLRRKTSVVAQNRVLFSTSIKENIIYGLPEAEKKKITDEEIKQACIKANA